MFFRYCSKGIRWVLEIAWFIALFSAMAQRAQAYVDPGSGLLFYQVTGSLLTGILLVLRNRVRRLWRSLSGRRDAPADSRAVAEMSRDGDGGAEGESARVVDPEQG